MTAGFVLEVYGRCSWELVASAAKPLAGHSMSCVSGRIDRPECRGFEVLLLIVVGVRSQCVSSSIRDGVASIAEGSNTSIAAIEVVLQLSLLATYQIDGRGAVELELPLVLWLARSWLLH